MTGADSYTKDFQSYQNDLLSESKSFKDEESYHSNCQSMVYSSYSMTHHMC